MISSTTTYTIPANEEDRLRSLYQYGIIDTPTESVYDDIATLAADIFGTKGGMVCFVDKDRVWHKSNTTELLGSELTRDESFCSYTITQNDVVVYKDTLLEPSIASHPMIYGDYGIRFYAAAPIRTEDGYNLGTVCVVDTQPRTASEKQLKMLKNLACIVMDKLEQRLAIRNAHQVLNDLMERAIHDLKSPVTAIKALAEEIQRSLEDTSSISEISTLISSAASNLILGLNELKKLSRIESGNFEICFEAIDIEKEIKRISYAFEPLAREKAQKIVSNIQASKAVWGDKIRVREIIINLVSNAIKYSYPGTAICINATDRGGYVRIEVCDEGQGLTEQDMEKLFTKFAKLSSTPTGKETSIGLGLHIVKMLVDLHGGKIWAESEGKDKGTTFIVELPAKLSFPTKNLPNA